jgi:hypothetical protein
MVSDSQGNWLIVGRGGIETRLVELTGGGGANVSKNRLCMVADSTGELFIIGNIKNRDSSILKKSQPGLSRLGQAV